MNQILRPTLPADLDPIEAVREALELTAGLPYSSRGPVRSPAWIQATTTATAAQDSGTLIAAPMDEASEEDLATVNSADYQTIVKAYTNKKGELSYDLLNKALIQAAHANPYIADLVARKESEQEICNHVVKANFEAITGNRSLSLEQVNSILSLLDAVSPRSVLSELHREIRRLLAEAAAR